MTRPFSFLHGRLCPHFVKKIAGWGAAGAGTSEDVKPRRNSALPPLSGGCYTQSVAVNQG